MLGTIREIFELDRKVLATRHQLDELPRSVRRAVEVLESNQVLLQQREGAFQEARTGTDRRELDLKTQEEQIQRFEMQLGTARTNKEYQALLHEIESHRADLSRLEDDILQTMTQQDEAKEEIERLRETVAENEQAVAARRREVAEQEQQAQQQLESLLQEREAAAAQIDGEILAQYERVLHQRGDTAVVPVTDEVCQGCFTRVSPEIISRLSHQSNIVRCQSCLRIIFLPEPAAEAQE